MTSKKGGVRLAHLKAFIKNMLAIPYFDKSVIPLKIRMQTVDSVGTTRFTVSIPTKKYFKNRYFEKFLSICKMKLACSGKYSSSKSF